MGFKKKKKIQISNILLRSIRVWTVSFWKAVQQSQNEYRREQLGVTHAVISSYIITVQAFLLRFQRLRPRLRRSSGEKWGDSQQTVGRQLRASGHRLGLSPPLRSAHISQASLESVTLLFLFFLFYIFISMFRTGTSKAFLSGTFYRK